MSLFGTNADNLFATDDNLSNDVYANDRRTGTDLSLVKLAAPEPVTARGTLTYTLTAANGDANPAPAAGIRDTLPTGVTFVSASDGCTHVAGVVDCELGTLTPGRERGGDDRLTSRAGGRDREHGHGRQRRRRPRPRRQHGHRDDDGGEGKALRW